MAELICEFDALGTPRPKGSYNWERGRARGASEEEPEWARAVGWTARHAYSGAPLPRGESVAVRLEFRLKRPARKPRWAAERLNEPSISYDLDKLTRSVFDALTGVLYVDDRQVVKGLIEKVYVDDAAAEGVRVQVYRAGPDRFRGLWV